MAYIGYVERDHIGIILSLGSAEDCYMIFDLKDSRTRQLNCYYLFDYETGE